MQNDRFMTFIINQCYSLLQMDAVDASDVTKKGVIPGNPVFGIPFVVGFKLGLPLLPELLIYIGDTCATGNTLSAKQMQPFAQFFLVLHSVHEQGKVHCVRGFYIVRVFHDYFLL
jgi:hypothetical protein